MNNLSVSKVINAHAYMARSTGIKRFKFVVMDEENIHVSKKSYPLQKNLAELLQSYVSNKTEVITGYLVEKGVKYKIGDHRYASNYLEVVVKVNRIMCEEGESLEEFINSESRICSDKNSRDRNILRMSNLLVTE